MPTSINSLTQRELYKIRGSGLQPLSGAVCQSTGPGSGGGTVGNHDALEQRTVRRTHKPAEGDQAPDVRKGEVRTSQSPCVALGGIGTSLNPAPRLRKTPKSEEEPGHLRSSSGGPTIRAFTFQGMLSWRSMTKRAVAVLAVFPSELAAMRTGAIRGVPRSEEH